MTGQCRRAESCVAQCDECVPDDCVTFRIPSSMSKRTIRIAYRTREGGGVDR